MVEPTKIDARYGQLALARGLVGLRDLIRCVDLASRSGGSLESVLIAQGFVSESEHDAIAERLDAGDEALNEAMQTSQTIVLDALASSRQSMLETLPPTRLTERREIDFSDEKRYELAEELGRGGMGIVYRARDTVLDRDVALKTVNPKRSDEKARDRLMMEARVTGVLEHPNIAPVYSLSRLENGEPFYTMRVVRERSLDQLLEAVKSGAETVSLAFLVQVLRQVSLAIQYAHDAGVVHRDLKPENILLGKYGEVYVIDWGIAKILDENFGLEHTDKIVMGALVGTPQYMSPEQARGESDEVGPRSDVYALGAILYEILTNTPMFEADHVLTLLFKVINDSPEPPSQRAPGRKIPAELEEICMRAVAKNPDNRYPSSQSFADELELFLEGVKEIERRNRLAEEAISMAEQLRAVYDEVRSQLEEYAIALEDERRRLQSWSPAEDKEEMWDLEQKTEDLEVEIERRFGETVRMYSQALVHRPEHEGAHRALASLYWQRFEAAERSGNRASAAYFEGLVRQHDDGTFAELLARQSKVSFVTEPGGAQVTLFRFEDVKRRLEEWEVAELAPTPASATLSRGSYVAVLEHDGFARMRVPFLVERATDSRLEVELIPQEEIPDDFLVISRDPDGIPYDFAMKRYPVTCGEYLEFLNSLSANEAGAHAPRVDDDGESYFLIGEDGAYHLPETDSEGVEWQLEWPIIMINFTDADAFAKWRSERDGRSYRLPTVEEWEKAARGADNRLYPWGNEFDAAFCRVRESRQGQPTPVPVGEYEYDRSPYAVQDLAGNVVELTSTVADGGEDRVVLKGASYNSFGVMARTDLHQSSPRQFRYAHYGFRLVLPFDQNEDS